MRVLSVASQGNDVTRVQLVLAGLGFFHGEADGHFGEDTREAVCAFQAASKLNGNVTPGVVDRPTFGELLHAGMDEVIDPMQETPPPPDWLTPVTNQEERMRKWGRFQWRPGKGNAVELLDDWEARHIAEVPCPATGLKVKLHKDVAQDYQRWMQALVNNGLAEHVLTVDCAFAPRFRVGSRCRLSAHCWGRAVDINATQNRPGCTPPYLQQPGSVRALVSLAAQHNFIWGGHNRLRRDGAHFEHT